MRLCVVNTYFIKISISYTMKNFNIVLLFISLGLLAACNSKPAGEEASTSKAGKAAAATGKSYQVNTSNSTITWTGSKIGGDHTGTLKLSNGSIAVEDGKVTGGSFTIDMNSLKNTDLPAEKQGDLEGHLKNEDFFDVPKYPQSKFEITKITSVSGDPAASHLVYGNLTVKDVTKQVGFKTKINVSAAGVQVTSPPFTIDRTAFNIKYGSNKFFDNLKDKAINDNISLQLNIAAS